MLNEKITIGNLTLKNRIVMPALDLAYCPPDGSVNERFINFYEERAKGGAGLIMIGGTAIEEKEVYEGFVSIHDDSLIPGHEKLVTRLKRHGVRVGIQLFHAGRYSFAFTQGHEVKAPSSIMSPLTRQVPRELTIDEIHTIIKYFGQAALRAKQAGYDVIEVISSAGYLINQFYSPATNERTDEYGGSIENRMRFGLEIIREIRHQVGDEMVLSVRLGGSDFVPGGNTWQEMVKFALELEKSSVNMINVTGGWHESRVPQIQSEVPRGTYAYLAGKIKAAVSIPVVASNRINNPDTAEEILQVKTADMVSVGRGFLADPDWANKVTQGKANTIRKCIGCMECMNSLFDNSIMRGVGCAINPQAGVEGERVISPALKPLKLVIIGAGPAGLEAARVAALKGHEVVLIEKTKKIGGQWNIAAVPPGKGEFFSLLDYYANILPDLGVEIRLNTEADTDLIKTLNPDEIIVATGALPSNPPFPIAANANVVYAWDVLNGSPLSDQEVVIIGGGALGCETALYIAELGTLDADALRFMMLHQVEEPANLYDMLTRGTYKVSVVEMNKSLGVDIGRSTRWTTLKHMRLMGIESLTSTKVTAVTAEGVMVEEEGEEQLLPADTVVLATGSAPNNSLYHELKEKYDEKVHLIGDALQPAKVTEAIHQAFVVANRI